jgi:hypothetical protein
MHDSTQKGYKEHHLQLWRFLYMPKTLPYVGETEFRIYHSLLTVADGEPKWFPSGIKNYREKVLTFQPLNWTQRI